jgi:Secreted and surface protein containing fasciclin-like repeats
VFAPTDNAFNAVPKETLNSLLNDIPKLKAVLLYHVVQGKYYSNNVKELLANQKEVKVTTLQGGEITITLKGMLSKSIYVNDAKVIKPDVEADNGVIHIIDKVIIPKI